MTNLLSAKAGGAPGWMPDEKNKAGAPPREITRLTIEAAKR
jgi:hypothetical protein